tara:strand:+ start:80 stop:205 length:126 start_codon:yes stop_codon:yes gene_type:complete
MVDKMTQNKSEFTLEKIILVLLGYTAGALGTIIQLKFQGLI